MTIVNRLLLVGLLLFEVVVARPTAGIPNSMKGNNNTVSFPQLHVRPFDQANQSRTRKSTLL